MLQHFQAHWPEEACGLWAGQAASAQVWYPIENQLHSPTRYVMEPQALLNALLAMEARGLELVAIAHSHPHGPLYPSPTDVAEAYYPTAIYLIAAPQAGQWAVRAFCLAAGHVRAVPLCAEAPTHP